MRLEMALGRWRRVVEHGFADACAQRHNPGLALPCAACHRGMAGFEFRLPGVAALGTRRETLAAGQHQPHRRIERIRAAALGHATAHRVRQARIRQRWCRLIAQDQHALRA
ncbi:hypothetical protein D9M72_235750 [compost metagenome]